MNDKGRYRPLSFTIGAIYQTLGFAQRTLRYAKAVQPDGMSVHRFFTERWLALLHEFSENVASNVLSVLT